MRVILYTKDFSEEINEPVDVILSPQYYWIKKIDIPIKSLSDAKKIAKTMFKLDESYIYDAFKTEDGFYAYAIKKNLQLNIDKKYIISLRLAQSELYMYDKINVSQNHSIQKIDGLLFCFPKTQNAPEIEDVLKEIKLSKNTVNLYNRINIDKSLSILGIIIFLLFNAIFILKTIQNKKALFELQKQKSEFIKKHRLPKTTFQLKAMLSELEKTDKEQKKIKKALEFITKTPLKKGEKFTLLSYDGHFRVEIKTAKNLDGYFSKMFKVKSILQNNTYKADLYE